MFYTSQVLQDFFPSTACRFFGELKVVVLPGWTFSVTGKGFDKNPKRNTLLETSSFGSTNKMDFASFGHECPGLAMLEMQHRYFEHPNCWFPCVTRLQIWNLFLVPSTRSTVFTTHCITLTHVNNQNIYNSTSTQPTSHTSEKHQPKHLLLRESSPRFLPCLLFGFISMALGLSPVFHWEPADDTVVTFDEVHRRSWLLLNSRSVGVCLCVCVCLCCGFAQKM